MTVMIGDGQAQRTQRARTPLGWGLAPLGLRLSRSGETALRVIGCHTISGSSNGLSRG
jgi:hypothetical protein